MLSNAAFERLTALAKLLGEVVTCGGRMPRTTADSLIKLLISTYRLLTTAATLLKTPKGRLTLCQSRCAAPADAVVSGVPPRSMD